MKKQISFFCILIATITVYAQNASILNHHYMGGHYLSFSGLMEMRDGKVLSGVLLSNLDEQGHFLNDYGYCLFKVPRHNPMVEDSVIVEDYEIGGMIRFRNIFMESDPLDEGYMFVKIKHESENENFLQIRHFNDSLVFDESTEVSVLLEDTLIGLDNDERYCLDGDDLIVYYDAFESDSLWPAFRVLTRFGIDGSLKDKRVYHDSICPINYTVSRLKVWNDSPKEYMMCGTQCIPLYNGFCELKFHYCVLDSLLQIKDLVTFKETTEYSGGVFFHPDSWNDLESVDENTYFVASTYHAYLPVSHKGVQVTKRDKITHENLKTIYFQKDPSILHTHHVIGLCKASDGKFYLSYYDERITVVKLDSELNVVWQRYYEKPDSPIIHPTHMRALSNGGIAIGGYQCEHVPIEVFVLLINDDGNVNIPEMENFIRPYTYYPNPAQDQLYLQYSPDIKPTQIELYDLQGRLVRTQRNGLESIGMESLPAGTYTMWVTLEDGKVFSDKVVKE